VNNSEARDFAVEMCDVSFGLPEGRPLLQNITFDLPRGETLVLIGRSGAGKTTLLKLINALLVPTSGSIKVLNQEIHAWDRIALRRKIGYVIQETGLFPHLSVEQNIGLVPHLEKWDAAKIHERSRELLKLVGLDAATFGIRAPHQLSGGQRQRVGVARALAADPPLLLMDEPFGALDPLTRSEIQAEFRSLQSRLGKSIVFVTHDIREALILGDRIGLLIDGKLHRIAPAHEFFAASDPQLEPYRRALEPVAAK